MPVGGGNQTTHTYEVTTLPPECKKYALGQQLRMEVVDPAPATITLNEGGACNGVVLTLVS